MQQHYVNQAGPTELIFLREMAHRINNEFASAIGALSLAARRSKDVEARNVLGSVMEQLHDYAGVHRCLQLPTAAERMDAWDHIRKLCLSISKSRLRNRDVEIVLVETELFLNSELCWKLGMIVSELITNADRHAFKTAGGLIRVELSLSDGLVRCEVSDTGTGDSNWMPGSGTAIMSAIVNDLGGQITTTSGPEGTTVTAIFFEV